jgi:predicted transcriptional regulator
MEVHFTPEQEAQLAEIAAHSGSSAETLVHDAALHLLEYETYFAEAVHQGVVEADRGEFIEEEEMDARFQKLLHP